jgi:hypothetical protein
MSNKMSFVRFGPAAARRLPDVIFADSRSSFRSFDEGQKKIYDPSYSRP